MADNFGDLGTITLKWMREPNWAQPLIERGVMSRILMNYPGTRTQIFSENNEIPLELKYLFMNRNKQAEFEFLSFFGTVEGRWKKFWIPEWKQRFELTRSLAINGTELYVSNEQHSTFIRTFHRIYFLLTNGDFVTRKIASIEEISETEEKIVLTTMVDRTIQPTDVVQCSLFLLVRLLNDQLVVKYHSSQVSEFTFEVRELIREYP